MKLKAKDTLHVSSARPDNIAPGEVFEVSDDTGRQLIEKGLATEVGGQVTVKANAPEPEQKSELPLANKMESAPDNKAVTSRRKDK
jgi:hypothetical protein